MYSGSWSPSLRQGDILGQIPFYSPTATATFVSSALATGAEISATPTAAQVPVTYRYVVVLSHDCEFNVGKRSSFIVARLTNLRRDLSDEQRTELRAANDIVARARQGGTVGALDTFVVDPVAGAFAEEMQVDFVTVMSCPMKAAPEYMRLKRAEMLHEYRVMLRKKVALFFGRDADDIPDEDKRPPGEVVPPTPGS